MPENEKKECKHTVLRPSGRKYHAPGHKIDGAESCDCPNCKTSLAKHIRPFVFPQLTKEKPEE